MDGWTRNLTMNKTEYEYSMETFPVFLVPTFTFFPFPPTAQGMESHDATAIEALTIRSSLSS